EPARAPKERQHVHIVLGVISIAVLRAKWLEEANFLVVADRLRWQTRPTRGNGYVHGMAPLPFRSATTSLVSSTCTRYAPETRMLRKYHIRSGKHDVAIVLLQNDSWQTPEGGSKPCRNEGMNRADAGSLAFVQA